MIVPGPRGSQGPWPARAGDQGPRATTSPAVAEGRRRTRCIALSSVTFLLMDHSDDTYRAIWHSGEAVQAWAGIPAVGRIRRRRCLLEAAGERHLRRPPAC